MRHEEAGRRRGSRKTAEPLHFTQALCPLPYLFLRHLLVGKELVNFPVVLEAPGKEEDQPCSSPPCAIHPSSHTATNSVSCKASRSTVRTAHRHHVCDSGSSVTSQHRARDQNQPDPVQSTCLIAISHLGMCNSHVRSTGHKGVFSQVTKPCGLSIQLEYTLWPQGQVGICRRWHPMPPRTSVHTPAGPPCPPVRHTHSIQSWS